MTTTRSGGAEDQRFATAYTYKLTMCGVPRILLRLQAIETNLPLALTCFEPDPVSCHRSLFSDWWFEHTGEIVTEWVPELLRKSEARFGQPWQPRPA